MELKNIAHDTLKKALKSGADLAEIFIVKSDSNKIDVLDQKIESFDKISDQGMGIRVIKDKRLGFSYTADFDPHSIDQTISKAIASAENTPQDEFNVLPEHKESEKLNIYDKEINATPIEKKIKIAMEIEKIARSFDKRIKKTEKSSYSDGESEVILVNSNGLDISYMSNVCGGSVEVIAEAEGLAEAGFGMDYVTKIKDLDPQKIGIEAGKRASELLGAKTIPSQKLSLIFDPVVGMQFLGAIASLFSSDSVQKGKSLFKGKIGKAVGSKILTIIDNGRLENAVGSSPFDGEGVPTQETKLIEEGILKAYLYNCYTGAKDKVRSTGNGHRGSFKGLPEVSSSNLYIEAGSSSPEDIIKNVKKGLLLKRVMGMHTVNPISGDFSVGAQGILIEGGKETYPVRGITIAGNLIEMLEKFEEIGNDLRFIGSIGSPTFLIPDISVSGS